MTRAQETFGEAVKALRASLGDTQQSFAQRIGLSVSIVEKYEHGRRMPRPDMYARLFEQAFNHDLLDVATMLRDALLLTNGCSEDWLDAMNARVPSPAENPR